LIHRRSFPNHASAVAAARSFVLSVVPHLSQGTRDRVELMVSELSTNAIKHARSAFNITVVTTQDRVRVEVNDEGDEQPVRRDPLPTDSGGRGLVIVQALSDEWGVEVHDGDKTVWFTLRQATKRLPQPG
jgi:anti-sigma regulatory factor (Ser/Thr protein kinase)